MFCFVVAQGCIVPAAAFDEDVALEAAIDAGVDDIDFVVPSADERADDDIDHAERHEFRPWRGIGGFDELGQEGRVEHADFRVEQIGEQPAPESAAARARLLRPLLRPRWGAHTHEAGAGSGRSLTRAGKHRPERSLAAGLPAGRLRKLRIRPAGKTSGSPPAAGRTAVSAVAMPAGRHGWGRCQNPAPLNH